MMSRKRKLFWVLLGTLTAIIGTIMALIAGYELFYRTGGIEPYVAIAASLFAFFFTFFIYDIYQMEELVTEAIGLHPHALGEMWKWRTYAESKGKAEMISLAVSIQVFVEEENSLYKNRKVDPQKAIDLDRRISEAKAGYEKLRRALRHFGVDSVDLDWDKMAKQQD